VVESPEQAAQVRAVDEALGRNGTARPPSVTWPTPRTTYSME
jgi:hypothetical protein